MIEHHIDIPTSDGSMNTFVVHPDKGGPFPVVLPNLYYRSTPQFELTERSEVQFAKMFKLMGTLNARTTEVDTDAMLRYVELQSQALAQQVGAA